MAKMGLKYVAWNKMTADTDAADPTYESNGAIVVGRMVSINVAISNSEGELYADDMLAEYASEFSSADLTAEVDNISLENQAKLYGATYSEDGEFQACANDNAPYGCVGGYQVLQINGVKKYRAWFYPKAKASMPDFDGTTKGNSVSFGTQPMKMKIASPKHGPWYCAQEFDTEADAKAYIDGKVGISAASGNTGSGNTGSGN